MLSARSALVGAQFRVSISLGSNPEQMMIDQAAAIEIARTYAVANGWAFVEPLNVILRRGWFGRPGRFEIEANAGHLGAKGRFVVDASSEQIVSEGFISR